MEEQINKQSEVMVSNSDVDTIRKISTRNTKPQGEFSRCRRLVTLVMTHHARQGKQCATNVQKLVIL